MLPVLPLIETYPYSGFLHSWILEDPSAFRIFSETLKAFFWFAHTREDMTALRGRGITEPIYTAHEIRELKGMSKEYLREIHKVKSVFPESVIEGIKK